MDAFQLLLSICLHVYTFRVPTQWVSASLPSTYPQVRPGTRLRVGLLAAARGTWAKAGSSPRMQIDNISQRSCHYFIFLKLNCKAFGYIFKRTHEDKREMLHVPSRFCPADCFPFRRQRRAR